MTKDRSDVKSEGVRAMEDWEARYKELSGSWFVAQVKHMISPKLGYYRQNLVLFKNFIEKA